MFMSCHYSAGQTHNLKAANKSLKNVVKFRHLGMTVTNKNYVREEVR
jgi:hypothetical protein